MTSGATVFRSILIYGLCLPAAMFLGYMLAMPLDFSSLTFFVLVVGVLLLPLALKWHYGLMLFFWNTVIVLPFAPGRPQAYMAAIAVSLSVSLLARTLDKRMRFLSAPTIAAPVIFLLIVVLITARFTGGIGLRAFGGDTIGGKKYFFVFAGILGYFALTSHRIPLEKAGLCIGLYLLSGLTQVIGPLVDFIPPSFYFIYTVFPVERMPGTPYTIARPAGLAIAAMAVNSFMLTRYGMRGIFLSGKPWRVVLFLATFAAIMVGGFRTFLILTLMIGGIQFYLEGLARTRLTMVLLFGGVLCGLVAVPFVDKLPASMQRSMAFLPVDIDPEVRRNAEVSSEWRLELWKSALPTIPDHLLLGTGYTIDPTALSFALDSRHHRGDASENVVLAGDLHSGPLSVVMAMGIWGVIGFVWLFIAGVKVLKRNFLYGDPALKTVNTYLLAAFVSQFILFCFVFGSFHTELMKFTGMLGLSVALNGGVSKPVPAPEGATEKPKSLATILPRVRPVFGRR